MRQIIFNKQAIFSIKKVIILCIITLIINITGCKNSHSEKQINSKSGVVTDSLLVTWTDSLEYLADNGNDEEKLLALSDLTIYYADIDIDKALFYAWKQKQLALEKNQTYWLCDAYENLGSIYFYEQNIDSTDYYFQATYLIWKESGDKEKIAASLSNLSLTQRLKINPDSAIFYLQQSLAIFEELKNESTVAKILANIASIYNDIGNNLKHDEYALRALLIQEKLDEKQALGITLINLCMSMQNQKRYDEGIIYGERALKLFRETNQPQFIGFTLIRVGSILLDKNEENRAYNYMTEAMQIADNLGNNQMKLEVLELRLEHYMFNKEYKKAKIEAENLLNLTDTVHKKDLLKIYDYLKTIAIYTDDKEGIIEYVQKYTDTKSELMQQSWVDNISEMEVRYDTEKKELQIVSMKEEKRLIIRLFIAFGLVLALALAASLFFWRLTVQKKRFVENQNKQLEQEKQLIATQSLLDGETTERTRISRDLHDGLGGMLSVLRLNLNNVKDSALLPNNLLSKFDRAIDLLDNSIEEMRRVAHHLMPDSLSRFGLKTALTDFLNTIPTVEFNYFGFDNRLDRKLELVVYRIIHELVNNAMKHASASNILVQLVQEPDRLSITVEDNGCGFDPETITYGSGINNILTRVESFGGTIDMRSSKGNGTEINIQLRNINYETQI